MLTLILIIFRSNSWIRVKGKHSIYADKFTRLFYLLIQLVWAANYGRWCRLCGLCGWWLQSYPRSVTVIRGLKFGKRSTGMTVFLPSFPPYPSFPFLSTSRLPCTSFPFLIPQTSFALPLLPSSSYSSLPLEVGPLIQLGGLWECCKLPQRTQMHFWHILRLGNTYGRNNFADFPYRHGSRPESSGGMISSRQKAILAHTVSVRVLA